jgi:hypothetical protein
MPLRHIFQDSRELGTTLIRIDIILSAHLVFSNKDIIILCIRDGDVVGVGAHHLSMEEFYAFLDDDICVFMFSKSWTRSS